MPLTPDTNMAGWRHLEAASCFALLYQIPTAKGLCLLVFLSGYPWDLVTEPPDRIGRGPAPLSLHAKARRRPAKPLGPQVNPWILSPTISQGACCLVDKTPCPQPTALLGFRGRVTPAAQTAPSHRADSTSTSPSFRPILCPESQVTIYNGPHLFSVTLF